MWTTVLGAAATIDEAIKELSDAKIAYSTAYATYKSLLPVVSFVEKAVSVDGLGDALSDAREVLRVARARVVAAEKQLATFQNAALSPLHSAAQDSPIADFSNILKWVVIGGVGIFALGLLKKKFIRG